ncbi:MAG: hypothetical protein IJC81_05305 [Clostridia bacterium]|nr:hypothetical protein [Clostridia bacterium]
MKKVLSLLLASLVLVAFVSCKADDNPTVTGQMTNVQGQTALPTPEEIGDISGKFNILVSGNWDWNDFEAEETSDDLIQIAIYERVQKMKADHNIDITTDYSVAFGKSNGQGPGFSKISNDYVSGTSLYDAAMIGTYDVATLAYNHFLYDLNNKQALPYINLQNDYWDQQANRDLAVNGKMYYTTGDISIADNRATYTLFFSKKMVEDFKLDNPYELVEKDEWTFEKFAEMVKQVGRDADSNGVYDDNDVYGLMTPNDTNLAILSAGDERVCDVDENGQIVLSLYSNRTDDLYSDYIDLLKDTSVFEYKQLNPNPTDERRRAMLDSNQALFYSHTMFYIDNLRTCENNFGILPYPKYDKTQEDYKNLVSAWHSQFLAIPVMAKNPVRSSYVIEKMAMLGAGDLNTAYYEKTLQGKRVRDEESAAMLDIIFDNLVYDIGMYYNIGTYREKLVVNKLEDYNFTVIYNENELSAQNQLEQINAAFAK